MSHACQLAVPVVNECRRLHKLGTGIRFYFLSGGPFLPVPFHSTTLYRPAIVSFGRFVFFPGMMPNMMSFPDGHVSLRDQSISVFVIWLGPLGRFLGLLTVKPRRSLHVFCCEHNVGVWQWVISNRCLALIGFALQLGLLHCWSG